MATIIWKGFEKEPTESLNESYELITGQNLKPSSKKQSKKQPGKPIGDDGVGSRSNLIIILSSQLSKI